MHVCYHHLKAVGGGAGGSVTETLSIERSACHGADWQTTLTVLAELKMSVL